MEIIIFAGLQASGKSTFFRTRFAATHVLVSKDLLRNNKQPSRRQQQLIEAALQAGSSVVVDNTNPTLADRAELIQSGRTYGAEIVGYYFEPQVKQSLLRNKQRTGKEKVPDVAIFATMKRFVPPTYQEGFDMLFSVSANDDGTFNESCILRDMNGQ
jgi:predicted kinase